MRQWLLVLLIACANTQAAEHGVKDISPGRLQLKAGEMAVGIGPTPSKIERVLIIIHGRLRNAETYRQSAEHAAEHAGQLATTLVIAPQFLNETDIALHQAPDTLLRWRGNDWMAGGLSTGPNGMSSYAALDEIIARLADRLQFPDVKEVIIAGHSGGGQVVQRYALLAHDQPALTAAGISVRYVVANPSSYAYFNEQRPVTFDHTQCPGFNRWKYGLTDMPVYASGQTSPQLESSYIKRDVTYLLGQQDTDPNHPALDKGCEAEAQGAYRLIRGHNFFDYLLRRHPQGVNQRLVEVHGVGHNGDGMFTSPEGQKVLFSR
ncbi:MULTISPECIES: alpha/beta fold hydrolase [unclassified Pseudomonas]|uniref:alpha/beta fold hydrolase n=1 Tax=unclassified Pseudomonas TaxID=196821 RepID=UPI002AC9B4EE|nr:MULTISPECIES: alpha/beta fold hydrolase [unclassified Pseudomonas]MEB0044552.1 alpha/beta hydrolase [Pseudomonas sp. Dout3]MEB0095750.1 alpha/beta hydrolase [Pseudomonas sp. DC1.2]WPX58202.1 alpha/beta hydrolase [Pseudomonas sp. DC1.2]